jgi:hypothetical protein
MAPRLAPRLAPRRKAWRAALALALGGAACANFDNVTTVKDLRVLSVRTDPSEEILDVADPSTDLAITVTPLIVDPRADGRPVTWTLLGCPNNPYGTAPPSTGSVLPGGGAASSVGSTLCPPDAPLTWPLVSAPLDAAQSASFHLGADQLTAAFQADVFVDQYGHVHGGVDLGLPINLQLTVTDGATTEIAVKRVLYWARRLSPEQAVNNDPVISGFTAYHVRDPDTFQPVGQPLDVTAGGGAQSLPLGFALWIQPHPATAESYVTAAIDPTSDVAVPVVVAQEQLRYSFYASAGSFAPADTSNDLPPGVVAIGDVHLESKFQPPATADGLPIDDATGLPVVTIWIVVRDERGGESWLTQRFLMQPAGSTWPPQQ